MLHVRNKSNGLVCLMLCRYCSKLTTETQKERYLTSLFVTNIYLFKVNNRNTRKRCKICSQLKAPQLCQYLLVGGNRKTVVYKRSVEKLFWNITQNLQENKCNRILFNKLFKKETLTLVFSCKFCKDIQNSFFVEHLRVNSSENTYSQQY